LIALLAGLISLLAVSPSAAALRPVSFGHDPGYGQRPPFAIRVDASAGYRPVIELGPLLDDPAFEEAARAGFPLRLRFRVELWRDGILDNLAGAVTWTTAVVYEPFEDRFLVRTQGSPESGMDYPAYADARAAIERPMPLELRPRRSGTYYYTAVLEIETLALSDLQELEQWLKGELQPAVTGKGSVPAAVGQGAKRFLVRVLGLPARRYDARSERFRVP